LKCLSNLLVSPSRIVVSPFDSGPSELAAVSICLLFSGSARAGEALLDNVPCELAAVLLGLLFSGSGRAGEAVTWGAFDSCGKKEETKCGVNVGPACPVGLDNWVYNPNRKLLMCRWVNTSWTIGSP
jgi:hypothetical protein